MKLLILNGPNLNLLGSREPEIYGDQNLDQIIDSIKSTFPNLSIFSKQSNHEGDLIDALQQCDVDGVIFNPAAFTHYSYAIADAIKAIKVPVIEVHLSDIINREDFRKISVMKEHCIGQISGLGVQSYHNAVEQMIKYIELQ